MKILFLFLLFALSETAFAHPIDLPTPAEKRLEKAAAQEQRGETDSAAACYAQAALLFQEEEAWKESVAAQQKAGDLYFSQRKNMEAIQTFSYLLDSLSTHLDDTLRAVSYFKVGLSHARMAQFVDALENMKQACQIREEILDPYDPLLGESYHMLGRLFFTIGDFHQSLRYQQRYLTINEYYYPADHIQVAEALHYVGLSYSRLYEHDLALEYYFKSIEIVEKGDEKYHAALGDIYNNIGLVYGRKKLLEEELQFFQKAIKIKKSFGSSIASNHHNLGRTYMDLEQYDKAQGILHEALELKIQEVGDRHSTVSSTYFNLSELHIRLVNYDSALFYVDQALDIQHESYGQYGRLIADSYMQIATVHQQQKDWTKALEHLQLALAAVDKSYSKESLSDNPAPEDDIIDRLTLLQAMHQKAAVLMQRYASTQNPDDLLLAYHCGIAATDMMDYIYRNFNNPESRTYLADNAHQTLELALHAAYELQQQENNAHSLETAFQLLEKNKAQLLLDNITASQWKRQAGVADSLLEQEQELNVKLAYYEKLRFEEENQADVDSLKLSKYQNQIFTLHRAQEALERALKEHYPQYYSITHENTLISLKETRQHLIRADELMIEYFQGDSALYCMAIDKEGAKLYRNEAPELPVEEMLEGLQNRNYALYSHSAFQLFTSLLAPVLEDHQGKKLIIIPDGKLGYIPFEALLTQVPAGHPAGLPAGPQNYQSLQYLILDHTIAYQHSAHLLASVQNKAPNDYSRTFSGYAPSFSKQQNSLLATRSAADRQLAAELQALPFAEEEVQSIANMLKGHAHIRDQATERKFKETATDSRMIHLASHTLIDDRNPLYSKLVFAPEEDSEEDGLLHTYELYNMHLNADMVTLSACNTGVGQIQKGEGVISLARGFMYAGVPNVLMSLWSVSDHSTSRLMQNFYQALSQGDSKAEALRTAKLQYLAQADANTAAPYYWGGFVLISNNQDVEASNFSALYFLLPLLALILVSWLFFRQKAARKAT